MNEFSMFKFNEIAILRNWSFVGKQKTWLPTMKMQGLDQKMSIVRFFAGAFVIVRWLAAIFALITIRS